MKHIGTAVFHGPNAQDDAIVSLVNESFVGNVATKNDLKVLRAELREGITSVRTKITEVYSESIEVKSELKGNIASVRTGIATIRTEIVRNHRLTIKIIGASLPWTGSFH